MANESTSVPAESGPLEPTNANETIVLHLFEETLGSGHLSVTDSVLAPEYVGRVAELPDLPPGPAGFKRFVVQLRRALFALQVTIDGVVARGADVVVRWTASGRHERPLLGFEPTCVVGAAGQEPGGRRAALSGVTVARVEDATIQESRTEWTALEFD